MGPLCEWALQCGDRVVNVVQLLEAKGKVVPTSFKVLEQFRDPADYEELVSVMLHESKRCNLSAMKAMAKEILQHK